MIHGLSIGEIHNFVYDKKIYYIIVRNTLAITISRIDK